jgi:hypothetical protein
MVDRLPLATTLKRIHTSNDTCVFCMMIDKNSIHRFISWHVAKGIYVAILQLLGSLIGNVLTPFQWVFIEGGRVLPIAAYKAMFDHLRYLGST